MSTRRVLLSRRFSPDHAQLEFGAVAGSYPQWEFGTEPLVANGERVVVATLPDFEGDVDVEVWLDADESSPASAGSLIYDGVVRLATGDAEAGTFLGGDLERLVLEPGEHRLRVFVDEPGYASRIVFLVSPTPA